MGRGVIKAQVSSRSSCTAGRSAAEADETIEATHAKTKETVRKKFAGILLLSPPCLSHGKNTAPRVFRFGLSLLTYINDGWGNRLHRVKRVGPSANHFQSTPINGHRQTGPAGPFRAKNRSASPAIKMERKLDLCDPELSASARIGGLETFSLPRYASEGLRSEIGPTAGKLKGGGQCRSGWFR